MRTFARSISDRAKSSKDIDNAPASVFAASSASASASANTSDYVAGSGTSTSRVRRSSAVSSFDYAATKPRLQASSLSAVSKSYKVRRMLKVCS